jgi:hypothetical protein
LHEAEPAIRPSGKNDKVASLWDTTVWPSMDCRAQSVLLKRGALQALRLRADKNKAINRWNRIMMW